MQKFESGRVQSIYVDTQYISYTFNICAKVFLLSATLSEIVAWGSAQRTFRRSSFHTSMDISETFLQFTTCCKKTQIKDFEMYSNSLSSYEFSI